MLRVVDGDTIEVRIGTEDETVRLVGINARERDECMAAEATARLVELLAGQPLRLEVDASDRDQYGRLLRFVFAGDLLVNEQLVADGLALSQRFPPDTSRTAELDLAQERAQRAELGLWNPEACSAAVAATIEVGEINPNPDGDDTLVLVDEWVTFVNRGADAVDLTGWVVSDESASHRYNFPVGFTLAPGAEVRLRSGCGVDSAEDLYWCVSGSAIWNNSGDTIFLLDPAGNLHTSLAYD